jgi:hypothetical protein
MFAALKNLVQTMRPRSLAGRAVLFTAALMTVTALLSASIVLVGADREAERQELAITHDLTEHLAGRVGDAMARGNMQYLPYSIASAATRDEVRSISIIDASGGVIAQSDGGDVDSPLI